MKLLTNAVFKTAYKGSKIWYNLTILTIFNSATYIMYTG